MYIIPLRNRFALVDDANVDIYPGLALRADPRLLEGIGIPVPINCPEAILEDSESLLALQPRAVGCLRRGL